MNDNIFVYKKHWNKQGNLNLIFYYKNNMAVYVQTHK